MWLSLRHALLFFATNAHNWAPYAFVPLSQVCLRSIDPHTFTFVLEASREETPSEATPSGAKPGTDEVRNKPPKAAAGYPERPDLQVQIVFLLPDGRWQAIEVPHLEVQVLDAAQLEKWVARLSDYCSTSSVSATVSIDTGQPVALQDGTKKP